MSMAPSQLNRLFYLCGVLSENIISPDEFSELNRMLESNPAAQEYYIDYVYLCTDLYHLQAAREHNVPMWEAMKTASDQGIADGDSALWSEVFRLLGGDEKTAATIELPRIDTRGNDEKQLVEKVSHKSSKMPLMTFVVSLAAMIILVGYVILDPRSWDQVATISDTIDAKWADGRSYDEGDRLSIKKDAICLEEGCVQIQTDEGVRVIIEGPSRFRFVNASEIAVNSGRLFAEVGKAGNGFSVQTPSGKVIDLGTEFGVYADQDRAAEVHVFKGKTILLAGSKQESKQAVEVLAGKAMRYDAVRQNLSSIALGETSFAHVIDSKTNLIWRGQKEINLADIVGNGDGFKTGKIGIGIDPQTGQFCEKKIGIRSAPNTYIPVSDSLFIDGVFVPNGQSRQVISSAGHVFVECPVTHGDYYSPLLNTPADFRKGLSLFLDEVNYSLPENPCIFMHSNLGITFDLNAFRQRLTSVKIAQFQTCLGVSETAPGNFNVDIWVLVDSRICYKKTGVTQKGLLDSLNIDLREQDRFLTLIVTEGKNTEDDVEYARSSIGCDWVIFGKPILVMNEDINPSINSGNY